MLKSSTRPNLGNRELKMIYVLINHICYESKWKNSALNRYGLKVLPLLSDFHFLKKN